MGKCVAGTIGAPYEGAKELFDFEYNPSVIENMLANPQKRQSRLQSDTSEGRIVHAALHRLRIAQPFVV